MQHWQKNHEDDQNKLEMDVITWYLFSVVYYKQKFNLSMR